nr:phage integrase N-terminal SAM-like domain-containing protein [uncultured Desulfobacter sp.]
MSIQKRKKIMDQVHEMMRVKHYSIHTERTYCDWIKRFIMFHNMKNKSDLTNGEEKIERFLTWLAVEKNVAPATQNQAMNALIFLYKKVLKTPLTGEVDTVRSTKKTNIPMRPGNGTGSMFFLQESCLRIREALKPDVTILIPAP